MYLLLIMTLEEEKENILHTSHFRATYHLFKVAQARDTQLFLFFWTNPTGVATLEGLSHMVAVGGPAEIQTCEASVNAYSTLHNYQRTFNLYEEYIMRNAGLEEAQTGIKIARRNINNLRYADDTTLILEWVAIPFSRGSSQPRD